MCIICLKPQNTNLPSEITIETLFNRNPHGCGISYVNNNKVYIEKGFMDCDRLLERLKELQNEIDIYKSVMMLHFRITTSGGTSKENCHPYPLNDNSLVKALKCECDSAIAHNGVISEWTPKSDSIYNDTQLFIMNALNTLPKNWYQNEDLSKLVRLGINGSRLCVIDKDNKYYLIGSWLYDEENNLYYSNANYKVYHRNTCEQFSLFEDDILDFDRYFNEDYKEMSEEDYLLEYATYLILNGDYILDYKTNLDDYKLINSDNEYYYYLDTVEEEVYAKHKISSNVYKLVDM